MSQGTFNRTVSLADLVALNDEIAALVRAGAPLDQGLVNLGEELPGRLGDMASQLGQRLQAGEDITRVLADESLAFPPIWRAMVTAGVRAGRLTGVLESLATAGRRAAELRRTVLLATIYPAIVCVLAYFIFVCLTVYLAPLLSFVFQDLTGHTETQVTWLTWLGRHLALWVAWPPLLMVLLILLEWLGNRRNPSRGDGPVTRLVTRCWPAIGRARRNAQIATFTEILSLLTRAQLPMPEALRLAGNSCGDERLRAAAMRMSEQVARGEAPGVNDTGTLAIPALLGLLVSTGSRSPELGSALSWTAQRYRERSQAAAANIAVVLPIVMTLTFGGLAVAFVSLNVFWPIWRLLWRLGGIH